MLAQTLKRRWVRLLKVRFAVLYVFSMWALFGKYSTDESILRSIWFILCGLGIRAWANFYAIKMEKLTTSGPYAYLRHPLYVGSFFIMVGFLVMLQVPWAMALIFIALVIGVIYKITIRNEEQMLLDKFGSDYTAYRTHVPAFFPAVSPFKGGQKWGPSIARYFRSQEYKLGIWMFVFIIVFHLKDEFLIEGERIDTKIIFLMATIFILALSDLIGEFFRKNVKSMC